jgi:Fe-S cluster assembly protein SufD
MAQTLRLVERAAPYAAQLSTTAEEPVWLASLRQDAMDRFQAEGFPTLRTEAWKYTNLERVTREVFTPAEDVVRIPPDLIAPYKIEGHLLVFVDGHFLSGLSELALLPEGSALVSLGRAIEFAPELLDHRLGHRESALAALNLALARDGAVLVLPKGVVLDKPVHVIHVSTGRAHAAHHLRHVIALGENAAATVVETHIGAGAGATWTNVVTEANLARGARLNHCTWVEETEAAFHTGRLALGLDRDAAVEAFVGASGAGMVRNEVVANLAGEGGEARIDGISLGRGRVHIDDWTEVVHAAAHTKSRQTFKSVLDDRSHAAFQGRVVVKEGAQKVDAHQINRNLLLSAGARADSKPELEILADDVKCSHGATVGDLDRNSMFYLRSRGIPQAEARALLIEAFATELIEGVGSAPVREWLKARLDVWLAAERERKAA